MKGISMLKYNHKANLVRVLEDTVRQGRPVAKLVAGGSDFSVVETDRYMKSMTPGEFQEKAEAVVEALCKMPRHWAYCVYISDYGKPSVSVILPGRERVIEWARRHRFSYTVEREYYQGSEVLAPWWNCELNINAYGIEVHAYWSERE